MSTSLWLVEAASPADPSCNVSEVSRLLWTMIAVAAGTGLLTVLRPTRRRVAALAAGALVWAWIDMEGPVLVSRGTHGLHLADVPVAVALVAAAVAAARLLWRRRVTGVAP